jgi:hypothetical protein
MGDTNRPNSSSLSAPTNSTTPEQWAQYLNNFVSQLDHRTRELESMHTQLTREKTINLKPPRPDSFHGSQREKVDLWIFEMEQYFAIVGLVDPHRVPYAASFLRDAALTWWRTKQLAATSSSSQTDRLRYWNNFTKDLLMQFKPMNSTRIARDRLHTLRQTGSMIQLISLFNTLCADIPEMTEEEKMDRFRRSCKPAIQQKLEVEDPKTLFDMQSLAQRMDQIMWNYRGHQPRPFTSYRRNPDAMELDMIEEQQEDSKSLSEDSEQEMETINAMKHRPRTTKKFFKKSYTKKPNDSRLNYNERVKCMQGGLCFKCKQKGHRIRECPQWKHLKVKAQ